MPDGYGTMTWQNVAEMLQEEIDIDWEEESFICPMCEEPILKEDYPLIACEVDEKEAPHPFCPICGFCFED